ncbi:hypothetical protein ACIG3E_05485 [Streptomyces sp. NPDC053474]|uniref:hypothetical protein n=1 Tax=Streptomyces sp. NPDC053474 TaxID=3365704 RepID=UPI0037D4305C
MFTDLPLEEAAKDPQAFLPKFQQEMDETRGKLRVMAGIVKELQKIATSTDNLRYIAEHGVPRPRESAEGAKRGSQQRSADGGPEQAEASPSRREQVLQLLGQQPRRHWKVRDIARALRIENVKSLRTSMDEFVRAGAVRKNPNTSTYYLEEAGDQTFF